MTFYQWLSLFGVPAVILALLTFVYKQLIGRIKKNAAESQAIKLGLQAMLRDRLYQLYRVCRNNGYATHFDRENFNSMYAQYHNLGANGVMEDVRAKFFDIPIHEE